MKEYYAKLNHIVGELTHYFMSMHSKDITSHIKIMDDHSEIMVNAVDLVLEEEELQSLTTKLSNPRQKEVEGYYWELVGGDHEGSELRLVSTMVDLMEISSEKSNGTIVKVKR